PEIFKLISKLNDKKINEKEYLSNLVNYQYCSFGAYNESIKQEPNDKEILIYNYDKFKNALTLNTLAEIIYEIDLKKHYNNTNINKKNIKEFDIFKKNVLDFLRKNYIYKTSFNNTTYVAKYLNNFIIKEYKYDDFKSASSKEEIDKLIKKISKVNLELFLSNESDKKTKKLIIKKEKENIKDAIKKYSLDEINKKQFNKIVK